MVNIYLASSSWAESGRRIPPHTNSQASRKIEAVIYWLEATFPYTACPLTYESRGIIWFSPGVHTDEQRNIVASQAPEAFVLHVKFESRSDGGLRARCEKVPNFLLSHSDPEKVYADVEPALAVILSEMYGVQMEVKRLPEVDEALDHQMVIPGALLRESYLGSIAAY